MLIILILLISASFTLSADDRQSRDAYAEGINLMESKKYRTAANKFKDAVLYADSLQLKVNALKKEAEAYKKGNLLYKEYICIKRLISNYPENCDVNELVSREHAIGDKFFDGHRDIPFLWLPWITDDDKSKEIYETVLKQSPYAKFVPDMLVRLGYIYLKGGENQKAITVYNKVIDNYEHSEASQAAHLDLANIYLQLAKTGDGDGTNAKNARRILILYIKRFPNTPEIKWAKSNLKNTYELEAERLYHLAVYYSNNNNQKAAKRYIKQILVNFPDSKSAGKSESLLDIIDMPLYPMTKLPPAKEETKYPLYELPKTDAEDSIIVIPENSGGKWMIPIKDFKMQQEKKFQDKYTKML